MRTEVLHGDCRGELAALPPDSFDSVVTDPPYEYGFMGRAWDRTGVAFDPATWQAVLRVLKPGGYMLAMGGTRTYHRLTCAVEDAGFEVRDCLADVCDPTPFADAFFASLSDEQRRLMGRAFPSDGLRAWAYGTGFPKGKGCLKPAWEPILLARKPGARVLPLGIDACRVATEERLQGSTVRNDIRGGRYGAGHRPNPGDISDYEQNPAGRYPANVLHDGSDEVLEAFAAFGESKSPDKPVRQGGKRSCNFNVGGGYGPDREGFGTGFGDTGTAARFFYCAKSSKSERGAGNTHPTVKPLALMRWMVRLVTPEGGRVLDPFAGSGSTLVAATLEGRDSVGVELDTGHCEIIKRRLAEHADTGLFAGV